MIINKENSFNAPEGEFRMKVVDASIKVDKKGREYLRVIGDLISLKSRRFNHQAGINYYGNEVEMLGHLEAILGDDLDKVIDENGEVMKDGLSSFEGKQCDVMIKHVHSAIHSNAYRRIAHISKPGVLVQLAA